ncbi:MAG: hypothetical protein UX17_C0027G0005 [Parcubacteria group bacterium GW2011_GWC2_45_7]|uniref:Uncharacterized protein n=1 Tax=Candidatus Magasanikbacteria bacterium GW2011_GWA2_50_22 TaxID=1619043 RepID=A0A0G1WFY3_9BACT|nr:MAG: hypothetical protein UX17_C0027G0005 [Parcubacteria group bacterium GW2011_GWC2_45_7]KKW17545.1 MAG: hypothetical protein UY58_C0002G0031 [Candidatus Magasanikbacteria bacterium GW2011_GWA2_50_22]
MESAQHNQTETNKLAHEKRKLLIIGVGCVALVIFLLWIINLKYTLVRNRERYPSPLKAVKQRMQTDNNWQQIQQQITGG